MELMSGNIFIRVCDVPLKAGDVVLGHRHNFDHTTYIQRGALRIELLRVVTDNMAGNPLSAEVEFSQVVRHDDPVNWMLILKGRFHRLTALEDGTVYHCIYAHQSPQAITVNPPGGRHQEPYTKRDEDGVLWVRSDEKILQDTANWAEAYR